MKRHPVKRATKVEEAIIRDIERVSVFDLVDQGKAELLSLDEYPEPLRRFIARERALIRVKLSRNLIRDLDSRSRKLGVPMDVLAKRLIVQGLKRRTG